MPFTVGLTGGIGCGKSTAALCFAELGAGIVDTDIISHRLTAPGTASIARIQSAFGDVYLNADGTLNRGKLRERVFSDGHARAELESILHPAIRRIAEDEARDLKTPYALLVVPLLFETGALRELMTRVLVVDCDERQQVRRAVQRGVSERQVRAIMSSQMSRADRLRDADDVIDNSAGCNDLRRSVELLHRQYLRLANP